MDTVLKSYKYSFKTRNGMRGGLQELKLLGLLGRVLRELDQGGASVDDEIDVSSLANNE